MPNWSIDFLATEPPEEKTSGLSRTVWELAAALVERGHRVRVLYPNPHPIVPPPYRKVERVPVPLVGTSRRPFGRDIAVGRNASTLLNPSGDVVVGNDEKAGVLELTKGSRAVFGMLMHDVALHTFDTLRPREGRAGFRKAVGDWLDRGTLRRLEGKAIKRARFIFVASKLNEQLLGKYYGVPTSRVRILPMGVPEPLDVGTREAARLALRIPSDVPVVAFVGRNADRQGLDIALDAFRRVRGFFPGARFLVAGSSPKAEPGVAALGVVDEETKARVLRSADLFLFPARYEGYGLAPREAMRYGVATVVSPHVPIDGIPVSTGVRVVTNDGAGDYASELAELLADPALRRKIGETGKQAADEFSYGKMAERFEQGVQAAAAA
jgi:glycosyltransferase involved in cell wall biosynthesis